MSEKTEGLRLAIALQVGAWNPGDLLPTYCGRKLVAHCGAPVSLDSWFLYEERPVDLAGFQLVRYDAAIVMCTPWLWDQAHGSRKYKILRTFTAQAKARKTIALGVGSSFLLHHLAEHERYPGEKEGTLCACDWQAFDLVICRDRLASTLFQNILPAERVRLLPCPSFYSAETFGISHRPELPHVLVFADINPQLYWGVSDEALRVANAVQDDLIESGTSVMTMFDRDRDAFIRHYRRRPDIDVRSPGAILEAMARYQALTSARVHACIPALSLGLTASIIPLDSRALTAIGLGAKPIGLGLDKLEAFADPIERVSFQEYAGIVSREI